MHPKKLFITIATLLFPLFLFACSADLRTQSSVEAIESFNMETADLAIVANDAAELAERAGKDNVLVVFDIDNTLLAMEQGLGADQWYEWQKELNKQDQCNMQNVGDRFAVQGALYFASAMRRTQDDGADQVKAIQGEGISVIALTSRGPDYQLQTFRELRRNDYSFAYSSIGPQGGYEQAFMPTEKGRLALFEDGVFLTAGQHKGKMLNALLEKTGTPVPAVIVMVDDKQKNLEAVIETFSALNVPVHAWRYTREDQNVRDFDPEQAHSQWKSIESALRQIQQTLGPDNYNLDSAVLPVECQ